MPLYLHTSNRLELLGDALADLSVSSPLAPLEKETVVLQSGGMARWVSMHLAARLGVSANLDFPFPNSFVDRIFRAVLPEDTGGKRLEKQRLKWQLLRVLPELVCRQEFAVLKAYMDGASDLKKFQLAGRLADLFDQYLIFRPELILEWESGRQDSWQAVLWNELSTRDDCLAGVSNRARLQAGCLEVLSSSAPLLGDLPGRLSVFGLSALPPYYLKIFTALATHLDVHFFFLNPCRKYWGDIVSEKTGRLIELRSRLAGEDLHLEQGNSLLASTGHQGRELLNMLLECDVDGEEELFREAGAGGGGGRTSLLGTFQNDILEMENGMPSTEETDRSVMIHACHSPMRELEVLHDQLLAMFAEEPELGPEDIIVMTPDIEVYSALIEAVFGSRKYGRGKSLPFNIADRSIRNEGPLVSAFLAVLSLAGSRLEISNVLAILEREVVMRKFSLSPEEMEVAEKWLAGVNIRWGIDGADRRQMGLPATEENSWQAGIDRLLLGYAMAGGRSRESFAGILPYDDIEGGEAEILGRILDFTTELFSQGRGLTGKRTLADWSAELLGLLEALFAADGETQEYDFLRNGLLALSGYQEQDGFGGEVAFEVVRAELVEAGSEDRLTSGFMTGGITFCEMLPMRAVPFKVVCLLGMNDTAYPRTMVSPGFDLIAADPRPGDRSRRKDDRYLFLETLLSARLKLYISYIGQSVRDGSALSPSVLVSELIEGLVRRFPAIKESLVTVHPLQAFSGAYFAGGGDLFSYSAGNYHGALALAREKIEQSPLLGRLGPPPEELRSVTVEGLANFFVNPTRFFFRKRLGVFLEKESQELAGVESFVLEPLARYRLGEDILQDILSGGDLQARFETAGQEGVMPHGSVGRAAFDRLVDEVGAVAEKLLAKGVSGAMETLNATHRIGGFSLSGHFECSPENGLFQYRFATLKPADLIRAWINHLFMNAMAPADWRKVTHLAASNKVVSFSPVTDSGVLLAELLDLYWQGLNGPLPFFPASSRAFSEEKRKGGEDETALVKARGQWQGSEFIGAERDNLYHLLCYGESAPFAAGFMETAVTVFTPLDARLTSC
ncbi:MAG: exodeoxyribonuclease V subunit gamma [Thermodesulfobacteriota bacterium]